MKLLFLVLALLFSGNSLAGSTVQFPVPYGSGGVNDPYFWRMAVVTGFSADGNYVIGKSNGATVTGHSGRGSTVHTTWSCVQWVWDLASNVVSETVLDPAHACSGLDPTQMYTNSGGYTAWTTVYPYYPTTHFPMLTSP